MKEVLQALLAASTADRPAALVTVIETRGSTPRHPGARMLVFADGDQVGTIGGGKIELEVSARARTVAARQAAGETFQRHLTRELAMCCGGGMTVAIEPATGPLIGRVRLALEALAAGREAVLAVAIEGHEVWRERLRPAPRAILFGGGHVAQALAPLCVRVGFATVVCDDDSAFASAARFPGARLVHGFEVDLVRQDLGGFTGDDFVVILTRDHAVDQALVTALLAEAGLGYLGLIGSRGKVARFHQRLFARGLADDTSWARLHAPVGLDIGAETPDEIAVAIVAELVAVRRGKRR
jgi:xanthine dehydrogenase accessory factor